MDINEISVEDNLIIIISNNSSNKKEILKKDIQSNFLQFHFAVKGKVDFLFNQGSYKLSLIKNKNLTLYNPVKDLPLDVNIYKKSITISILITIKKFHELFSKDTENIPFLGDENINQKYYNENTTTEAVSLSLNQILNTSLKTTNNKLYLKSKLYDIFSLIFIQDYEKNIEQCPFIMSDDQLQKIRKAKEIIIERFDNPPSLIEISEEIKLSLRKLKEVFKEVYGKPVFQYLLDYKMELSRKMLTEGVYNVNEISLKLGYSTASHFIAAFKKKFSITPKKYVQNNY